MSLGYDSTSKHSTVEIAEPLIGLSSWSNGGYALVDADAPRVIRLLDPSGARHLLPATGVRPQPSPAAAAGIAGSQTALRSRAGLSHLTTSSSRPVRRLASWWGALPAAVAAAAAAAAAAAPSAGILTRRIQRLCEDIQSIQVQSNGFKENLCLPGTCYAGFPVTKIRLIRLFW
jgi:hypothetical protein